MSAALTLSPPTTLAAFLDWERGQELRYEWDGVQPIAMVGGTFVHSELATRLSDALRSALRGGGCTVVRADVKVLTERGDRVRYPDLVVTCSPIRAADTAVPDPVLIVEVLSESTAGVDLGIKRAEYAALPSLRRYVVLSNEAALAFVFTAANGFRGEEVREVLDLPELGVSLPLAPLYAGLLREPGASSGQA
jgi:Uma2 family endonuclease